MKYAVVSYWVGESGKHGIIDFYWNYVGYY